MTPEEFIANWHIRHVYHFTERANLPSIKEHGLLSLKELERRQVDVAKYASSEDSRGVDRRYGIDGYVRLCFMDQHPMEYRAREDGRLENTTFLRVSPEVLKKDGIRIADGVAYAHDANIYDDFEQAAQELDWEVLFTRMDWKQPEIKGRLLRAKKYELLVPDHIPTDLILNP